MRERHVVSVEKGGKMENLFRGFVRERFELEELEVTASLV